MSKIYAEKEIEIVRDSMFEVISNSQFFTYRLMAAEMFEELELAKKNIAACYRALAAVSNLYELNMYKKDNPYQSVELNEFVKDLIDDCRTKTRRQLAKIEYSGEEVTVACNKDRLFACVMNLLVNALQEADPDESVIKVTVKNIRGYALLTVTDNAYGLKDANFDELTSEDATGGLAVVARFCEHVGTTPIFETSENNGFSVGIKIPECDSYITLNASKSKLPMGVYSPINIYLAKIDRFDIAKLYR